FHRRLHSRCGWLHAPYADADVLLTALPDPNPVAEHLSRSSTGLRQNEIISSPFSLQSPRRPRIVFTVAVCRPRSRLDCIGVLGRAIASLSRHSRTAAGSPGRGVPATEKELEGPIHGYSEPAAD